MFRSKFDSWPQTTDVAVSEDGRGKVAGQLLKCFLDKFSLSILYPSWDLHIIMITAAASALLLLLFF
jgi:hypothetical protein